MTGSNQASNDANRSLRGRIAVVTGSTRGIGKGIAQALARAGAATVVNGRSAETVEATVAELSGLGSEVLGVAADVSQPEAVERLFQIVDRRLGPIDILVNNAALVWDVSRHFLNMDVAFWDQVVSMNLRSVFLCSRQAAKRMAAIRAGSIINLSSVGGARAHRESVAYDATKGAIDAATRAMALDLAAWRIRVNALAPGWTRTEDWSELSEDEVRRGRETIPLGREGTAADMGAAAVFLASADASYITGHVLHVDGGLLAQLRAPQVDTPPSITPETYETYSPRSTESRA